MRTYKFRLYPTEAQRAVLESTLETCRHLYNDSVGERSADWDVGFYEQNQLLVLRKQENKFYKQVHSQVLQDVVLRLDKAYIAFFKKLSRYPRFKRKEQYNSFTYPQYGGFKFKQNKLLLSFIGAITIKMHRIPVGTLKQCTIIRDIDQWFCCITTDDGAEPEKVRSGNAIGIDLGLLNWMTMSSGNTVQNPVNAHAQASKIKQLQRRLARKERGSHNREKTR
ncbi:MAG: RNA-guided endonuclease InsQ/TnpB family protein, partial [Nitrososphaera sp.]